MKNIILVGAGAMGKALSNGWKAQSHRDKYDVYIVHPHIDPQTNQKDKHFASIEDLCLALGDRAPSMVIFAVKPQVIKEVVPLYGRFQSPNCPFISIAAGTSLAALKASSGDNPTPSPWVRVMPNLGATVGWGVAGLFSEDPLTLDQQEGIRDLFLSVGKAFWVDSEDMIDRVTAISGSGPAYFFRFVESLTQAAVTLGFSQETAELMAQETLHGASELLKEGGNAALFRQRVTSPGGTTAAALSVFDTKGLDSLVDAAVKAAYNRAKEL